MRGRLPTPTKILEARGSWRAKTRKNEPKPLADKPACPSNLTPEEQAIWDKLTEQLHAVGCITVNDGWQVARYCTFFVNWCKCKDKIATDGMLLQGEDALEEHPILREFHRLDKALKQIEREFGLTPTARVRLAAPSNQESDDPMEAFLSEKRN